MKKYRLKKWVKVVIGVGVVLMFVVIYANSIENFNQKAKECDSQKGYICSYYEVEKFIKNN